MAVAAVTVGGAGCTQRTVLELSVGGTGSAGSTGSLASAGTGGGATGGSVRDSGAGTIVLVDSGAGGGVDAGVDSHRDAFDRDGRPSFPNMPFPPRQQQPPPPSQAECVTRVYPRPLRASDVMLVVGRNASMAAPFGVGTTRIQAVEAKLMGAMASYPNAIHFGYLDYPSDATSSCTASATPIRPNTDTSNAIQLALKPCDGGPTAAGCLLGDNRPIKDAMDALSGDFQAPMSGDYGKKFTAILIADGPPGCGPQDGAQDPCMAATNSTYGNSQKFPPIKTYVIALVDKGTDPAACLKAMANQGGTTYQAFPVADGNDLQMALDTILGYLARTTYCAIDLITDPRGPTFKFDHLTLRIAGQLIQYDPTGMLAEGGWSSSNDPAQPVQEIQVHGPACVQLQKVTTDAVEITYSQNGPTPCP